MKIAVTGHTRGLGKYIYDHYSNLNNEVIGISRTTGYDIEKNIPKILEKISDCNLLINNAYCNGKQLDLLKETNCKIDKIVSMGSLMRKYSFQLSGNFKKYSDDKQKLYNENYIQSLNKKSSKLLHLDLGFVEQDEIKQKDHNSFKSDNFVSFKEIIDLIDFWIINQNFSNIEFEWKMTDNVLDELKRKKMNLDPSRIFV